MMLTKTNVLTFCLLFLTQIHFLRAEDGYDLWLRYVPVADAARFAEYRAQIEGITIFGNSDNLNRHVERGYAGASLWDWHRLPDYVDTRYKYYARANASIGINSVVLTNVNANALILTPQYLEKVKVVASVF